jgi:hypothetical protein
MNIMNRQRHLISTLAVLILGILPGWAQVPQLVNFQGRVVVNGINFDGTGSFKVAIIDPSGPTTLWSNDGTSVAGSEPTAAVQLNVVKGLYSVLLGDATLPNMTTLSASVFQNGNLFIRVWFNDGVNGSQLLSPDQRLAAVGYALMANNVPNGSITGVQLANGAVTNAKIAGAAITSDKIAADAVGPNQLAANAVQSAKILDGTILGTDLVDNTLGGTQLADFLELGSSTADGTLHLWDNGFDLETIRLRGGSSEIVTFGSDGLEQARIHGLSWGELLLKDNTPENNNLVTLAAHEQILFPINLQIPGGALSLSTADGLRAKLKATTSGGGQVSLYQNDGDLGVKHNGDASGGGESVVYQADGQPGVELSGTGSQATFYQADDQIGVLIDGENAGAGYISLRNSAGSTRVSLDGDSTGTGGEMRVFDADGTETVEILGAETTTGGGRIRVRSASGVNAAELSEDPSEGGGELWLYNAAGVGTVAIEAQEVATDGAQVNLYNNAGTLTMTLDAELGDGGPSRVTTGTIEITGGSDLSEQFEINPSDCGGTPVPGMIVCIDPENPGQLLPSTRPYDRTVAGIISGAGGVRPGLLMGQQDSVADGEHPVALSGRVYCMVDAGRGSITPGDLITTSDKAGHGMKVTDHEKARGAIIGKAMTRLEGGTGLVLVLVSLQ